MAEALLENVVLTEPILCSGGSPQPGDMARLFLDQDANPGFPEFIDVVIQFPLKQSSTIIGGCLAPIYIYSFIYDTANLPGLSVKIRPCDILNVECLSGYPILQASIDSLDSRLDLLESHSLFVGGGPVNGQILIADSSNATGTKWATILTGAGIDCIYNSASATLLFSLTPDQIVLFAGNGAFAGSNLQITGGLPVIYHTGDYAPISATEGDTITPYRLRINGVVSGGWFQSEVSVPMGVEAGDIITIADSAGNLSNSVVVEIQDPIGILFNRTSFTDFSGLETNGGFVVSGGKLVTSGSIGSNYTRLATASALDSYKATLKSKMTASDPANYGLALQIMSINPSVDNSLYFYVFARGGDYGKLVIYDGYSAVSRTGPALPGFGLNIDVTYEVEKTSTEYIFKASTSSGAVQMVVPILYTSAPTDISNNTFKLAVTGVDASTFEIAQFKFESAMNRGGNWAIGDSITAGFNAGSAQARWATRSNIRIQAGPGDKTAEVLARLPEIINFAQPEKVFLMIGTNNANDSTYHTQLASIVSQLETASIEVVVMTPPARSGADMSGYRDYIAATYPAKYLDVYAITKAPGSSNLKNEFNTDGTHPNSKGNLAISNLANSA